jgi:hypothetical protein
MRDRLRKMWNPDLEVTDEVDSFLDGSLAVGAGARAGRLPAWAWISTLAHGGVEVLEGLLAQRDRGRVASPWERAVGFLAGEALDLSEHREEPLRDLQEHVLVPAELHFLDQAARGWSPGPEQFASVVLAELEGHRRAGPRFGA